MLIEEQIPPRSRSMNIHFVPRDGICLSMNARLGTPRRLKEVDERSFCTPRWNLFVDECSASYSEAGRSRLVRCWPYGMRRDYQFITCPLANSDILTQMLQSVAL
jgi:hypothetical protein